MHLRRSEHRVVVGSRDLVSPDLDAFTWARFLTTEGALEIDDAEAATLRASLARQIDALDRNIETRLQANHLHSNPMGVVLGRLLLDGDAAAAWRGRAAWLEQKIGRQVHGDGAPEERSLMYRALLPENVLDLVHVQRLSRHVLPGSASHALEAAAARMLGAPDGHSDVVPAEVALLDALERPHGRA